MLSPETLKLNTSTTQGTKIPDSPGTGFNSPWAIHSLAFNLKLQRQIE